MGRLLNVSVSGALVLGLFLAGCGGSGSTTQSSATTSASTGRAASNQPAATTTAATATTTTTATQTTPGKGASVQHTLDATVKLSSHAFQEAGAISARYTCDGADISPPVQWSAIPPGTAELVLFISSFKGSAPGGGPLIYWAVAGLRPTLKGIDTGTLPAGSILGRNSLGQTRYSICPPRGSGTQHYVVSLYALPHSVAAAPGFAAGPLFTTVRATAEHDGLIGFSYKRA
jgi:phosphatidylethanolamine-binding protein (PEBP) family uncharacterized protein